MPALPPFDPAAFLHPGSADARLTIAVSACLTGAAVRYDGGHKYLEALDRWLRPQAELLPLCPEAEGGLGTPRPPVQLVRDGGELRARGRDDPTLDVTDTLHRTATATAARLQASRVSGYLWKSRSPSCGLGSTPLFDAAGREIGLGSGLQASQLRRALPWLAMAEELEVMTAEGAWRFLLNCRLVHDARLRGAVDPAALARCYMPLHAALPHDQRQRVERGLAEGVDAWLATLPGACAGVPFERLRALFAAG